MSNHAMPQWLKLLPIGTLTIQEMIILTNKSRSLLLYHMKKLKVKYKNRLTGSRYCNYYTWEGYPFYYNKFYKNKIKGKKYDN